MSPGELSVVERPAKVPTADACLFCRSCRCRTRIYTADLRFDEVACGEHVRLLERLSDQELGTALRTHVSGSLQRRTLSRRERARMLQPKPYHRAKLISDRGDVSPLCAKTPRVLNLQWETWTLQDEAVTCSACLAILKVVAGV